MYSPLRFLPHIFRKQSPLQLTILLTARCNLNCPFCFYLKARGPKAGMVSQELSLDEMEKIARTTGPLLWLLMGGGEPFLRDDLVEISRVFYRHTRPSIVTYTTNGSMPETVHDQMKDILEALPHSVVVVKISLDGVGTAHDSLRESPGSFQKAMKTYDLLCRLAEKYPRLELGFNSVFCSANQDDLHQVIEYVHGLPNAPSHTVSMIRGDLSNDAFKKIDLEKYRQTIQHLESAASKRTAASHRFRGAWIKTAQDILQRRLIHETLLAGHRLIPCYAGSLNLVITETGELYPCELSGAGFGNVRHGGFDIARITASPRARRIVEGIETGDCYCSHECVFMTNILFNPRLYRALAKEYWRLRLGRRSVLLSLLST